MNDDVGFWPGYYEVIVTDCIVVCDEWTEPADHIWHSYVVFPYGETWRDE